ncbi:hypothetical protein L1887_48876 [Cichorium endivia]|nr:hypothetical protein L1887_48876 [Cichorium endivia]
MSTSGLVMLTFALADAESAPHGWKTSYVLALLPTSVALLAASFPGSDISNAGSGPTRRARLLPQLRIKRATQRSSRRRPPRRCCRRPSGERRALVRYCWSSSSPGCRST